MDIKFLNPLSDPDWDRVIVSHPDYSFFHSAAWAKVLSQDVWPRTGLSPLLPGPRTNRPDSNDGGAQPFDGPRGVCLPFTDFAVHSSLVKVVRRAPWKRCPGGPGAEVEIL